MKRGFEVAALVVGAIGAVIGSIQIYQAWEDRKPRVTVLSPNGGETFSGVGLKVSWMEKPGLNQRIVKRIVECSYDGGGSWDPLGMGVGRSPLPWKLAGAPSTHRAKLRITVINSTGDSDSDVSDASFSILTTPPSRKEVPPEVPPRSDGETGGHGQIFEQTNTPTDVLPGNELSLPVSEPTTPPTNQSSTPPPPVTYVRPVALSEQGDNGYWHDVGPDVPILGQKRGVFRIKTECDPMRVRVIYGGKEIRVRDLTFSLEKPVAGTRPLTVEVTCSGYTERGDFVVFE